MLKWLRARSAVLFGCSMVLLWLALALSTDQALMGDNIEQAVWSHSWEWGYFKHPPLPSWLLAAAIALIGPAWWLTPVLASLCLIATLIATHALAVRLTTPRTAQLAVVLWGLHLTLTWRSVLYNHNTVLIALCAALCWAVVRAVQDRSLRHWLLSGWLVGLALLTKYQAGVMLLVLLAVLLRNGYAKDALHRRGFALGALVALLVVAPHVAWLAAHQFEPLRHASAQMHGNRELSHQASVLGFYVQQLRLFWPAWISVLLCVVFLARGANARPAVFQPRTDTARVHASWVRYLVLGPPLIVLLVGLAGTRLQNHWGLQTLQFASLGLAVLLRRYSVVSLRRLLLLATVLHVLLMATALNHALNMRKNGWDGEGDRYFPARLYAQSALKDWAATTSCPLQYVVGWAYEAGTLSVFSGQNPRVFESGTTFASPWINPDDVQRKGALYVAYARSDLPTNAAKLGSLVLAQAHGTEPDHVIHWAVVAPQSACATVATP